MRISPYKFERSGVKCQVDECSETSYRYCHEHNLFKCSVHGINQAARETTPMYDAIMTTRESQSLSNGFYGYLRNPSGLMLPKVLRDQLQQSLKENGEGNERREDCFDTNLEENKQSRHQIQDKERYWNVVEIVDMINATSQKLQNIQTQITNGEDFYVNNVTSISVYNSKNNYSDSTTFLDSKTESTSSNNYTSSSNTGGNTTTNSHGVSINHNQHRWFSSSFTNMKPYQQSVPYPTIPRKENCAIASSLSFIPSNHASKIIGNGTASSVQSRSSAAPTSSSDILAAVATTATTAETTTVSKDASANTITKRGRSSNVQPPPPPTRRSTKRRRKT